MRIPVPTGYGLNLLAALLLALAAIVGLELGGTPPAFAAGTSFGNCPDMTTFQGYLDAGGTIIYTGTVPCTIPLSGSLTVATGQSISIDGGTAGLAFDGHDENGNPGAFNLINVNEDSTLVIKHVTLTGGANGIYESYLGSASVTLEHSEITDINGGYQNTYGIIAGTATMTDSTISDVSGTYVKSWGIFAKTVAVENSTVSGISNDTSWGIYGSTSTSVINSTVSDVSGSFAYGVYVSGSQNTITDSTISGVHGYYGYGIWTSGAARTFTVTASILAGNTQNCSDAAVDGGYNLSTDGSCDFSGTSLDNATGLNLLPLDNYGGPTKTIALGPGSVAIDAIPADSGQCSVGEQADQRGVTRPQGTGCDVGAYEAPAISISTSTSPNESGWYTTSPISLTGSYSGLEIGAAVSCVNANDAESTVTLATATTDDESGNLSGMLSADGSYQCGAMMAGRQLGVSTTSMLDFQIDTVKPVVECSAPDTTVWHSDNVNVDCTSTDAGSGLDDGSQASVSLTTSVATGSASDHAIVGPVSVCDVAGNCADVGPYTYQIDRADPAIALTTPADGATYTLGQAINAAFTCNDVGSGIAATGGCTGTVTAGGPIDTSSLGPHTFAVTATDAVGHTAAATASYTVGYQIVTQPGNTGTVRHGYFAMFRFAPMDAQGNDYASRTTKAQSVELIGPTGQVIPFVHAFQVNRAHRTWQYQLTLNTRNLATGDWTLEFTLDGNSQIVYTVSFTIQ